MRKSSFIWGIVTVFIFIFISIILLIMPCGHYFGLVNAGCQNYIWFALINLIGGVILKLSPDSSLIIKLFVILTNVPVYFCIGWILNKIFSRKK